MPLAWAQQRAGGEFTVNTYTTGFQFYPSVASDCRGNFVVVWSDEAYVHTYVIKGRRFDRAGVPLGSEFTVNTAQYGKFPAVAMGPKGDFLVVWVHDYDGSYSGIHGRRFDANANPVGVEFQVNTYTTGLQRFPNLTVDGRDNFVVAWWSYLQDGSGKAIAAQRFDAQGNRLGAEFLVNTYTTGSQVLSDISSDAAGNFVIVWGSSPGTDSSPSSLNGQRYDANGVPQGGEFQVNTYTMGSSGNGAVAHAPDGSFVVAFQSQQNGSSARQVIAKRYDTSGNPIGGEFQVNTYTTAFLTTKIAMDAQGNFVVSWGDISDVSTPTDVFARRFRADGTPRGRDFRVNTTNYFQHTPNPFGAFIASDEVGNFVVTWQGVVPLGTIDALGQRYGGLYPDAMAVDPAGNLVWEPGEAVEVRPSWFNANGAAQTFAGTFANISGPVGATYTIIDDFGKYGPVDDNTRASCTDCYTISVTDPASRPVQHWDASVLETLTPDSQGQQKRWSLHIGKSFTDVPNTSPFYRFVETLLHKGVTCGCGGTNYCPSRAITRDQMAAFLLLAKEGAGYSPPACGVPMFNDVPASSPFCKYIEELARRGVVSGCGGGNYCPGDAVTREQMAVFVLRTLDPAMKPPACGTSKFNDVPASSPFCPWIMALANRGVVTFCGEGNYCPDLAVTREEMSVFLSVAFGLTLYGP
jgi:hypothetical protein